MKLLCSFFLLYLSFASFVALKYSYLLLLMTLLCVWNSGNSMKSLSLMLPVYFILFHDKCAMLLFIRLTFMYYIMACFFYFVFADKDLEPACINCLPFNSWLFLP